MLGGAASDIGASGGGPGPTGIVREALSNGYPGVNDSSTEGLMRLLLVSAATIAAAETASGGIMVLIPLDGESGIGGLRLRSSAYGDLGDLPR